MWYMTLITPELQFKNRVTIFARISWIACKTAICRDWRTRHRSAICKWKQVKIRVTRLARVTRYKSTTWKCHFPAQQIAFFCRSSESWDSKAGSSPSILWKRKRLRKKVCFQNKKEQERTGTWFCSSESQLLSLASAALPSGRTFNLSDTSLWSKLLLRLHNFSYLLHSKLWDLWQEYLMFTRSEPVLNLERCFFQEIYLILQAVSVSVFIFPARFVFSFHVCSVQKTPGRWSRFSPGDQRLAAKTSKSFQWSF